MVVACIEVVVVVEVEAMKMGEGIVLAKRHVQEAIVGGGVRGGCKRACVVAVGAVYVSKPL
jgi:hypothetical protein